MASLTSTTKNPQAHAAATLQSRRGQSAKGRDKLQASMTTTNPNAAPTEGNENMQTSGINQTKNLLTKRYKKPAYLQSLNESEKAENFKIIDNMNKKISYLKNPRF